MMKSHCLLILFLSLQYESAAFILERNQKSLQERSKVYPTRLNVASNRHVDFTLDIQKKVGKYLSKCPGIQLLSFSLIDHKPLGCSAEECLKVEDDGMKHVFISSLVGNGHAEKAGILVGDVLVGISGSFTDVEDVFGMGLSRIRSLIAGRPADQCLELYILRGSDIQSKHDTALVDLCILPEDSDIAMGNCIKVLYEASYDTLENVDGSSGLCDDKDTECMLDAMFRYWDEDEG